MKKRREAADLRGFWTGLAVVTALGCQESHPPPQAPDQVVSVPPPAPSAQASPGESPPSTEPQRAPPTEAETPSDAWQPGQPVVARGKISDTPWQHLVGSVDGKRAVYFDLAAGGQTIIYVTTRPSCPGSIEVRGSVHEVRGASKRPGQPPSKVDDSYRELHIDVAEARCVP